MWQDKAACHGVDPDRADEVFFPPLNTSSKRAPRHTPQFDEAREWCDGNGTRPACPVKNECLTTALTSEKENNWRFRFGMYGGLDPIDRARLSNAGTVIRRNHADAQRTAMLAAGTPIPEIARATGTTRQNVRAWAEKRGLLPEQAISG